MLFRVLGPVEVQVAGEVVPVSAEKPRRLLSVLLLHANAWVPVDILVEEIWPAGPPASAAGNIRTYISQLRQLVPPPDGTGDRIDRRANSYRLTVDRTEVDATIFEELTSAGEAALAAGEPKTAVDKLTEALELWRGKPYESVETEKLASAVARLTELRWTAHDTLAAALTATDRAGDAVVLLREVLAENPLREPTWKLLMTALHAAGRRADALTAYHQARHTLVEALGVEPGPDLQRLHHRLLREEPREPLLAPPPAEAQQAPPVAPPHVRRRLSLPSITAAIGAVLLGLVATVFVLKSGDTRAPAPTGPGAPVSAGPVTQGISPRRSIPGFDSRDKQAKVLFGVGDQATSALASDLVRRTPANMLTTWVHKPNDLNGLRAWRTGLVAQAYRDGQALHLIIADWDSDDPARPVETPYGLGCGQPYPLSVEFLDEARELAGIFAGGKDDPPLYVTVFHGVNIYGCEDGSFKRDPATTTYLRALQDRYVQVREIFHHAAPNARVAMGWQGWQAETDEPSTGSGRSMFQFFDEVLRISDFQSVVSWEPDDNIRLIRHMVRTLGRYGPVLVEYGNDEVMPIYDRDVRALLDDDSLTGLVKDGLFAWNFSDTNLLTSSPLTHDFIKATVRRRGAPAR